MRIYIAERGNKYGVYTAGPPARQRTRQQRQAAHKHGPARPFLHRDGGNGKGPRDKFLATGQYFGYPKPFRPIQMDATDNPGNCETTKLR